MRRKIYSIPFGTDFIEEIVRFIEADRRHLSEVLVVTPGKRPAIYFKERLARHINAPFYPPTFFTMEEFIDYTARGIVGDFTDINYLDGLWLIYKTIRSIEAFKDHPFAKREFGEFFHWGKVILRFIDELDMEGIDQDRLITVEKNAAIGYDIPESVNELIVHLNLLREEFHANLLKERRFTRGYKYLYVLRHIDEFTYPEFEKIYFAGIFALTGVERRVVRKIWEEGKADIIIEGEAKEWKAFESLITYLGAEVERLTPASRKAVGTSNKTSATIKSIASAFDTHSQGLRVYERLKDSPQKKTAIVLPLPESLFPLLTFAIDRLETQYNISLRYPFSRTPIYDLVANIVNAIREKRVNDLYPVDAYLSVIMHPFIKNMDLDGKIGGLLSMIKALLIDNDGNSLLSGRPFITLKEVESAISQIDPLKEETLKEIHKIFFYNLNNINNLYDISCALTEAIKLIIEHTALRSYILSWEMINILFDALETIKVIAFSKERLHKAEEENRIAICDFILHYLSMLEIPFDTRPIEATEIIGMLETRNLSFERVIMLDVNEGIIPGPKEINPLVPIGIYEKLGLPSPSDNEEIYRYYFYRLLYASDETHLIYVESDDRQRSRYIEQLIWAEEEREKRLNAIPIERSIYRINFMKQEARPEIKKTKEVYKALLDKVYSPSSIETYIKCPLLFYYKDVIGLERPVNTADDLDGLLRGTIIHRILYDTFIRFKGLKIDNTSYKEAIYDALRDAIERAFEGRVVTGEWYLFKRLAEHKLMAFLEKELSSEGGNGSSATSIIHLEEPFQGQINVMDKNVRLKGKIDRIDYHPEDKAYLIIDYKTGGSQGYRSYSDKRIGLTSTEDIHKANVSFQMPLYLYLFNATTSVPYERLNGKMIFLKDNKDRYLFKDIPPDERHHLMERCLNGIRLVIGDILNPEAPFKPFDDKACETCSFSCLCPI